MRAGTIACPDRNARGAGHWHCEANGRTLMCVCVGETVDRRTAEYANYMTLETREGKKRVCWNSQIAPHNREVLEDRIRYAQNNVAAFNAPVGATYRGDKQTMVTTAFSCMACHQQ